MNKEKVIKAVEEAFDLVHSDFIGTDDFSETEWEQNKTDALALLKEQDEKPLRCDKCSYHREDGWCGMHGRWVKETDYCSLGAWKGR